MATPKKPIQSSTVERSKEVATPSPEEVLARYMDAVKSLELMKKQLENSGITFEVPPTETTVVRDTPPGPANTNTAFVPPPPELLGRLKPGQVVGNTYRPWRKEDLANEKKYELVPQWVPGAVHPIQDAEGKWHIFLCVNELDCCLTVWEINHVSGMFYHAYKNIEDQWKATEEFKKKGPVFAPWVTGGLGGTNTWFFQGEAPAAWIDIDGQYYRPGAEMPLENIPTERPPA